MPQVNKDLLEAVMRMLWQVDQNSSVNSMVASNLAIVFGNFECLLIAVISFFFLLNQTKKKGPTLLYTKEKPKNTDVMAENAAANTCVQLLITNYDTIFKEIIAKEDEEKLKHTGPVWKQRLVGHKKSIQGLVVVGKQYICSASTVDMKLWDANVSSSFSDFHLSNFCASCRPAKLCVILKFHQELVFLTLFVLTMSTSGLEQTRKC